MTSSPNLIATDRENRQEEFHSLINSANNLEKLNGVADNSSNQNTQIKLPMRTIKPKKSSSESQYRTSSSSINSYNVRMSATSVDDEDERFYDAIDVGENGCLSSPCSNLSSSKIKRFIFDQIDGDENEDDLDDDEDVPCFFDTKTSRHASEMSDCSVVGSLPIFRNGKSSLVFEDKEVFESNTRTRSFTNSKLNSNKQTYEEEFKSKDTSEIITEAKDDIIDDDDDETDVELESEWSFWVDRCVRGITKEEYEAGLKLIHSFKTVQTFWSIYNNIPDISALPNNFSYHLMRNNNKNVRRPLWEDNENRRGGQWKLKCKKEDTSLVWRELLLAGIGEQFSDCVSPIDDIVGLTVGKRDKDDIIQIWNLDHTCNKSAKVCEKLQELVPDVKFSVIFYKAHSLHEAFEGNLPSTSAYSFNNNNNLPTSQNQKNYNTNNIINNLNSNSNQFQHLNQNGNKNNNKFK